MPKKTQQYEESSDDFSEDLDECDEVHLDEAWENFKTALLSIKEETFEDAMNCLADAFGVLAKSPEDAKSEEDHIKTVYNERDTLIKLLGGELKKLNFSELLEISAMMYNSFIHVGLKVEKEELMTVLDLSAKKIGAFENDFKDAATGGKNKSKHHKNGEEMDDTKDKEEEEEEEEEEDGDEEEDVEEDGIDKAEQIVSGISLLLYPVPVDDLIWYYNEFYRGKLLVDGWNFVSIMMIHGFFEACSKCDFSETEKCYKVELLLDDIIDLISHMKSTPDIEPHLIHVTLAMLDQIAKEFTIKFNERDGRRFADEVLSLLDTPALICNPEFMRSLWGIIVTMVETQCIWMWKYYDSIRSSAYESIMGLEVKVENVETLMALAECVFALGSDKEEDDIKMVRVLEKVYEFIEHVLGLKNKATRFVAELIDCLIGLLANGFLVSPFSDELSTKIVNTVKVDKIKYPRKVSDKTVDVLLHEMCGGFMADFTAKSTKIFFAVRGTGIVAAIARILSIIVLKAQETDKCLKDIDGVPYSGASIKGMINYARNLTDASMVFRQDASTASIHLTCATIERASANIWKAGPSINSEWISIRQIIDVASNGIGQLGRGCGCGDDDCDHDCCEDEDSEREENFYMEEAIRSLVKAAVKAEIAPLPQMEMMLVKMKVPKLHGASSFDEIKRSIIIFVSFYEACLMYGKPIDANFFKANIKTFFDKLCKEFDAAVQKRVAVYKKNVKESAKAKPENIKALDREFESDSSCYNAIAEGVVLEAIEIYGSLNSLLPKVTGEARNTLQQDINQMDSILSRYLTSLLNNKGGVPVLVSAAANQDLPMKGELAKRVMLSCPRSIKAVDENNLTLNETCNADLIEAIGGLVMKRTDETDALLKIHEGLLESYGSILRYSEDIATYNAGHLLTHLPSLAVALWSGKFDQDLCDKVIEEMRMFKVANPIVAFCRFIISLPEEQKSLMRSSRSLSSLVELLKFVSRDNTDGCSEKDKEDMANVKELIKYLQ